MSIVLLTSIIVTTIVYSAFSTQLQISGEAIVRSDNDIRISNVKVLSQTNNAYETYNNKYTKDTTSMFVTLPSNSSITYEVEITNKVSDSYLIDSITQQSHTNSNVNVDIDLNINDIVNGNSTKTFTIILTNNTAIEQVETLVYKYQFKLNSFTVTFDANGGQVSTASKTVSYGSSYGALSTPTRTGYTFKGWNGKNLLNMNEWLNSFTKVLNGTYTSSDNQITLTSTTRDCYTYPYSSYSNYIIYIKPNTTYTLSWQSDNTTLDGLVYVFVNNSLDSGYSFRTNDNVKKYITFTTPSDATFLTFRFGVLNVGDSITYSNIQLEENSIATAYEPYYIENTTTVVQPQNHILTAIWEPNT